MGSCWQCLFLYFDIAADGLKEVIVNTYADITARMEEGTVNRFVIFTQFGVLLLSFYTLCRTLIENVISIRTSIIFDYSFKYKGG